MVAKGRPKFSAVFISDLSPVTAPLISAWAESGHQIAAIVGDEKNRKQLKKARRFERLAVHWSHTGLAKRYAPQAPFLFVEAKGDWDRLAHTIERMKPDILVCAFFIQKIPEEFIRLFTIGAVNLHPALLPRFRGPLPLPHLIASGSQNIHGGVTLHVMTERFDAGPIIAQARMPSHVWDDRIRLSAGLSGAAASLLTQALPGWCSGKLRAVEQQERNSSWAGIPDNGFEITPDWSLDRVQRALNIFTRRPSFYFKVNGELRRVRGRIKSLGPPSGEQAVLGFGSTEFDIADARIQVRTPGPIRRFLARRAERKAWPHMFPIEPCQMIFPSSL